VSGEATTGREVVLETGRLLLRPWRVAEAFVLRELWTERDPRVPPHRRIGVDGRPTVADPYGRGTTKAARILAALKRDGWIETRR